MSKKNKNQRNLNKFQYYLEDTDCIYCQFYLGKKKGCSLRKCCCLDEKQEAIANKRFKRERGSLKWDM